MLPLAVTMGEPAGIGGEIALKAWLNRGDGIPPFYLIDDPDRLAALAECIGWPVPTRAISAPDEAASVFGDALPVAPIGITLRARPGHPDPADAQAVVSAIEAGVRDVMSGRAGALVTNPIHKESLYRTGFQYPGHTEYLAALAGVAKAPVMMLACPGLRVVPVTVHLPLRRAIQDLSSSAIVHAGRITEAALRRDFGVGAPRLAVAGLNPHAGEGGALGAEEVEIIAPAVKELQRRCPNGTKVGGPFSPDTIFYRAVEGEWDAVLCMYHDQGLIPLKLHAFHAGVNVTIGLPFPRTSPDHGTAFEIAGKGIARPDSTIAAIKLACDLALSR